MAIKDTFRPGKKNGESQQKQGEPTGSVEVKKIKFFLGSDHHLVQAVEKALTDLGNIGAIIGRQATRIY